MKRRLTADLTALARALVARPALLLLDEPSPVSTRICAKKCV